MAHILFDYLLKILKGIYRNYISPNLFIYLKNAGFYFYLPGQFF